MAKRQRRQQQTRGGTRVWSLITAVEIISDIIPVARKVKKVLKTLKGG